jgi:hypothetical protein
VEAAVAWAATRCEHRELPFKPEDARMHHGDPELHGGIIQRVSRFKRICAIDHQINAIKKRRNILCGEHPVDWLNVYVWIQRANLHRGGLYFQHANAVGGMDDLTLQVGGFNRIKVDDSQMTNSGRRKIKPRRRTESTSANHQDACLQQFRLTLSTDAGEEQVS